MKKIFKGVLYVLLVVVLILGKGIKQIARHSNEFEHEVNKTTQVTKKMVNKALEKPNWTLGGVQATRSVSRINAQTHKNIQTYPCLRCNGTGRVMDSSRNAYYCSSCNGTGRIKRCN